jgi:hypothetical protein
MYTSELIDHIVLSTKITPSASQKTVALTFPANSVALNFF